MKEERGRGGELGRRERRDYYGVHTANMGNGSDFGRKIVGMNATGVAYFLVLNGTGVYGAIVLCVRGWQKNPNCALVPAHCSLFHIPT